MCATVASSSGTQMMRPVASAMAGLSCGVRVLRHGKFNDIAPPAALPLRVDRFEQLLDTDVAHASGAGLVGVLDAGGRIVVQAMARPAWHAVLISVQGDGVAPVLGDVLGA